MLQKYTIFRKYNLYLYCFSKKHKDYFLKAVQNKKPNDQTKSRQITKFISVFAHFQSYSSTNSYEFPIASRNLMKSALLMMTVPVLSLGWKLSLGASRRFLSMKRCTSWFSSLMRPNGETLPGFKPRYFSMRASDAKVSLP